MFGTETSLLENAEMGMPENTLPTVDRQTYADRETVSSEQPMVALLRAAFDSASGGE